MSLLTAGYVKLEERSIRQHLHLVPGHGAQVRYSLDTNVSTPFFQVPSRELGNGAGAQVQGLDLVFLTL